MSISSSLVGEVESCFYGISKCSVSIICWILTINWPHYFQDNFLVCELAMFIAALIHCSHGFDCIIDIMACVCKELDSDSLVYMSKVFVTLRQLRSLWFQQKEQYSLGPKIPWTNVSKKSKYVSTLRRNIPLLFLIHR